MIYLITTTLTTGESCGQNARRYVPIGLTHFIRVMHQLSFLKCGDSVIDYLLEQKLLVEAAIQIKIKLAKDMMVLINLIEKLPQRFDRVSKGWMGIDVKKLAIGFL